MITKIQYITATDRANVLTSNSGKFLTEEQNITEGNFLIFTDIQPVNVDTLHFQMVWKDTNVYRYFGLKAQVLAPTITTIAQVNAFVW